MLNIKCESKIFFIKNIDTSNIIDLNPIVYKSKNSQSFKDLEKKVMYDDAIEFLNMWIDFYKNSIVKKKNPDAKFIHSVWLDDSLRQIQVSGDCMMGLFYVIDSSMLSMFEAVDVIKDMAGDCDIEEIPFEAIVDYIAPYMLEQEFPVIIEREDNVNIFLKNWTSNNFIKDIHYYIDLVQELTQNSEYKLSKLKVEYKKIYNSILLALKIIRIDEKDILDVFENKTLNQLKNQIS